MSTTSPPLGDSGSAPSVPSDGRLSMALSEGEAGISSSRSSLSISGPVYTLPDDFDAKHYETPKNLINVIRIQAFIRQQSVQQHYNLILKLHRKRTRVAKEIWNSETTYLEGLLTMYQFFYLPLSKIAKEAGGFITEDQVKLLFGNLQQLMDQAKRMNTLLAKVVTGYTAHSKLGYIFTDNAEQLKAAFTPYVDPFDEANALFLTLKKDNERFREWLAGVEFKTVDLGLESYLIMPIQRVTRYGLLLRELIHQTWQDHEDWESLNLALQAVEQVASHVNGHKKKVIMQTKIKSILSSIVGLPDISSNDERMYITEGPVTDLGEAIPVTHHIFLFSDLMIWTQMINKKKFMYRKMNWLKESTAEAVEKSNSFKVMTNDWTTTVFTKTKEDQNKWLAYLENDAFTPNSSEPQPKRPDVVFLEKARMVDDTLKRGMRRRNAGPALNKDGSKRGSTKMKKGDGTKGDGSTGKSTGQAGDKKDKPRKIPRGYATVDPKMMEEVKAANREARAAKESSSKEDPGSTTKTPSNRDPLKVLTKKPKGSKKGETITPEVLEALRATRNMTESEQAAYLETLQREGHSSLPPDLAKLQSGGPDKSSSAPALHEPVPDSSSSQTSSTHVSSSSDGGSGQTKPSGKSPSWKGPPPPMPDVSHVKRDSTSSTSSNSTDTFGSRIRTSTSLTPDAVSTATKPRGQSVGPYATVGPSSRPTSMIATSSTSPDTSESSAASSSAPDSPKTAAARPTRLPPIAKRTSNDQLVDKRRSGSVTVTTTTSKGL